ncbi:hypothetical protein BSK62_17090 [Paenibacillus odorifer]|uniref:pyocin knob domain-containing protein n=1 Tax=Paenibacillus odorifer TaxID=189426 RepID=UPI00097B78F7|nr:pyocin knob domain-containing protein [Paenibacillus odorifer]OMD64684.1 hypothetical protein BSK62_17090 [Paenibacillus odorifer]
MAYNKQQWRDEIPDLTKPIKDASGKQKTDPQTGRPLYELVQEGTRITSARLNHIEDGIETVNELADQNTADIDTHKKDTVKHITAAERAEWKAKETPAGAQTKADAALSAAKTYADTVLLAKADKSTTYSKTETDQRIQAVVGAAPDALDTLKEIGDALNNDPNFAATVTNQLSGKVDKVSGKQLSTEDYSSAEKAKLAGLTPGAGAAGSATDTTIGNRTADPSITTPYSLTGTITQWFSWLTKYLKSITGKANPFDAPDITLAATKTHVDDTTRHITAVERTAWNVKETPTGAQAKADAAQAAAIATAATDATTKANSAQTAATNAANTALALKAPLASPALTGTPTAPTATAFTNNTQLATTAFVKSAVDLTQIYKLTKDDGRNKLLPVGTDLDTVVTSGFYDGNGLLNVPPGSTWWHIQVSVHSDTENGERYVLQKANPLNANSSLGEYSRRRVNGGWGAWTYAPSSALINVAGGIAGLDINGFVSANNLPYGGVVNLLGDSGRFMGTDGDPRSLQIPTSFANNSFLSPWNGTTVFSGGKFIHDNTTNGGTAGALTEDVTSLLTAMSLGGSRYGTEFYIASYTMGSGTANAGNVAGTYLMTVNSNFPATGVGKAYTVAFWVRVKTGTTISIPRDGRLSKNGVSTSANYIALTPADGWVHIEKTVHASNGYYNAAPAIAATPGAVVQIAMPVVVAGAVGVGVHTSPVMGSSLGFVPLPATSYTAADILSKILTVDGVGSGLDADLHAGKNMGEIANGTLTYAGLTKGTAPALTASIAGSVITSLIAGDRISFKAHAATTGPVTLNVNGLGAKSIKKPNGNNPPLALGGVYTVVYDGTAFILQGEGGEYGTAEAAQVLSGYTVGRENGVVNGTMPDRTRAGDSLTYTTALSAKGDGFGSLVMEPQTGYYASGLNSGGFGTLLSVDPNFVPSSILSTKTIFGVPGNVPVIAGVDVASGVGRWGNGDLAIYPLEGYRKGGMGAGEIKVTVAQLNSAGLPQVASGTIESGDLETYTRADGSTVIAASLIVSGLTFKPTVIIVKNGNLNNTNKDHIVYDARMGVNYRITTLGARTTSNPELHIFREASPVYVNSTGFKLPVINGYYPYTWIAIQ